MYQKYQTEALVLGSRESAEADRTIELFTRDFGLVSGRASAIRKEKSKMRYGLTNYSFAEISLVKGKHGWRLAGSRALRGAGGGDKNAIAAFARISELVTRLVVGEEANANLFAVLAEAHRALMLHDCSEWATIELVCVARILYSLGYISTESINTSLFSHTAYTGENLQEAEMMRAKLLSSINHALLETHL